LRTFLFGLFVCALLGGGIVGGWTAMNYYNPGTVGTPAHAGSISNGRPETCTTVNFHVNPRGVVSRPIPLDQGDLLRGTFEADGGFGRVNIFMRIVSPQGDEMGASPKASNYDFNFSAKYRGEYSLVFDNRYSLYTSKSIGLYYCIDRGRPASGSSWQPGQPPPR
jgi:hypothetical protein